MILKVKEEQLRELLNCSIDATRYRGHDVIDATKMEPMTLAIIYNNRNEEDLIEIVK